MKKTTGVTTMKDVKGNIQDVVRKMNSKTPYARLQMYNQELTKLLKQYTKLCALKKSVMIVG